MATKLENKMENALRRFQLRPAGDGGWCYVDMRLDKRSPWYPDRLSAHSAKIDAAIEVVRRPEVPHDE